MHERVRQIETQGKITLSVFKGSSFLQQIPVLENYKIDVEVCLPVFVRENSVWTKQIHSTGFLDV